MRTVAIHGFLGLPSDWDLVFGSAKTIEKVDLWQDLKGLGDSASFQTWTDLFIDRIQRSGEKAFLIGYSMGGRLAMHALLKAPQLFSGAVIVSSNPGLSNSEEKAARLKSDLVWADRFASESWAEIVDAWNAQSVLATPKNRAGDFIQLVRRETSFDRRLLSKALDTWSLGRQENLSTPLTSLAIPIRFITGSEDAKFSQIAKDLVMTSRTFRHQLIPQAGHRAPWDNPSEFRRMI